MPLHPFANEGMEKTSTSESTMSEFNEPQFIERRSTNGISISVSGGGKGKAKAISESVL